MRKIILLGFLCFCFLISHAQVVSLTTNELAKLKKMTGSKPGVKVLWRDLLKIADEAIIATPNPADTILTEGILQGNPRKIKTWESLNDMQKVYALSLAYKLTGDQKYLNKASEFLGAWAKINHPQGNPINDTNLDRIIFAYDLLKNDLSAALRNEVALWLEEVANQEIKSYNKAASGKGKTHVNNWNSHRIKEVAEVAWAINNAKLKEWAINTYKMQIEANLLPDGSSYDFHERDALHYHIYDVDPLLVAATIIARDGSFDGNPYTFTSKTGSSLKKSIDWLIPFYTGEKTHAEWVNSKSAFDKKRAANGEKGYIAGTLFKPAEARTSIALAHYFERQLLTVYQKEIKEDNNYYPTWQFVLNEVKR
jgi:hypothetical protein